MDSDFLLESETARHLYHDYAEQLPLIDYHCHISPKEIYEDRRFDNLAEVWLGGDHYKWRLMRSNGVSEDFITGDQPAFERFRKFAEALELAIGNPMYHWCHLELKKYFGFEGHLTAANAEEVWNLCNEKLRTDPNLTVRGMIRMSNVGMIGTTDDPIDSLEWHQKIAADPDIEFKVCPSFRPDIALNIGKPGFKTYLKKLAACVGRKAFCNVDEIAGALEERIEYFYQNGCRAADHGLDYVMFRSCTAKQANDAYHKALSGDVLTREERECYQTYLLLACARAYQKRGIVMQLHYSCLRNANARMFATLGADTGFDMINSTNSIGALASLLSALDAEGKCPKTIIYSLNPTDNAQIGTLLGSFQGTEVPGKIQQGSGWWFNDNRTGMIDQMTSLANLGILGNFVGMLTDSRSFLSYTRHEYFRRILCNLIGTWVENGDYPADEAALKRIVEGICCKNAIRYFGL